MKPVNCFIVDDEPLAIDVIKSHLEKLQGFEISGTFTDPLEAFFELKNTTIDLLFIDIQMPDLSGLDFIKTLKKRPEIIITTAYREFAATGFDLNILDYLVKPISFERFIQAIDKYLEKQQSTSPKNESDASFILLRADRKFVKVPVEDILYVEGLKDYVKIVMKNKQLLTKLSIGQFEKKVSTNHFIRIHKSYIASLNKITAFTNYDVELGEIELPIGSAYKENLLEKLQK